MSNRIDDWFDRLICIAHYKNPKACPRKTASKKQVARASDNLYNLLLEDLIGSDETFEKTGEYLTRSQRTIVTKNVLRAEQRTKLRNIFGKGDDRNE